MAMSREPNDREFEAILGLPPEKRYRHFMERIVDFDHVWMAEDDDGLLTFNHRGGEILPVWPARRYAEHVLKDTFPDARFVAMTVRDWLEHTLCPLERETDVWLAVFPDADGYGCRAACADMIADLEDELGTEMETRPGPDAVTPKSGRDNRLEWAMKSFRKAKPSGKPH